MAAKIVKGIMEHWADRKQQSLEVAEVDGIATTFAGLQFPKILYIPRGLEPM